MGYPAIHNANFSYEKWTSALIVVILLLLIAPTLLTVLGVRVAMSIDKQSFDIGADQLRSRR